MATCELHSNSEVFKHHGLSFARFLEVRHRGSLTRSKPHAVISGPNCDRFKVDGMRPLLHGLVLTYLA